MLLKTVDVGLMANHLSAHKAIIKRLNLYSRAVQNKQLATILEQQVMIMRNHVQTMNQLLDPNQQKVSLPPIPNGATKMQNQIVENDFGIDDHDIAIDAHFTASSMAKENFNSSENMKNQQVKQIHSQMAMQQSQIAERHEMLAQQMGWASHPNASIAEQTAVVTPLETMPNQAGIIPPQQMDNQNQMH
ncbi:hypothetical protein [Virgibacillus dakarensis]|uniref:hypothetical protein n=1 Tax=Virgibacillus dakarensis TaxID=1917889 RepID=UPI000B42F780|nr:hypothetical protein [Virgibacillus dakarensis]